MSVLLDTHIWVWWLTPGSPLSRAERDALDAKATRRELFLPAISLWEAQVLHAKRRLELPLPFAEWLARATDERMISVLPLSVEVVLALDAQPVKQMVAERGRQPGPLDPGHYSPKVRWASSSLRRFCSSASRECARRSASSKKRFLSCSRCPGPANAIQGRIEFPVRYFVPAASGLSTLMGLPAA